MEQLLLLLHLVARGGLAGEVGGGFWPKPLAFRHYVFFWYEPVSLLFAGL